MKNLIFLLLILVSFTSFSQDEPEDTDSRNDVVGDLNRRGTGLWMKPLRKATVKGDVYLFDNWKNLGAIFTEQGSKYNLKSINYDTKQDRFVTRLAPDSVFVFSAQSIKQVKLKTKNYKRYFNQGVYKYYEVLAYAKGLELLKKSKKELKKGAKDPFTNGYKSDRYILITKYFFNSNLEIKELKLRKRAFLGFFGEDTKKIKQLMSKHKLSYKKEKDLVQLFDHYKKIQ